MRVALRCAVHRSNFSFSAGCSCCVIVIHVTNCDERFAMILAQSLEYGLRGYRTVGRYENPHQITTCGRSNEVVRFITVFL